MNENTMPRIGDYAPDFVAITTQGKVSFPGDFKGKWKILFSHPADFTPVCTTEFMAFGSMAKAFEELNCQLIGLSIDSLYSHIAWLRAIKDIEFNGMSDIHVHFPLIVDVSMEVARKYGMIHSNESDTAAVRAVFFIDPEDKIRCIMYYPMSLGRNFDEIKRVLIGLQTTDHFGVSLPADWRPGDDVIVPNATTCATVQKRMEGHDKNVTCHEWFLCTKELPAEEIERKIVKR